jgi:hypothetical protein
MNDMESRKFEDAFKQAFEEAGVSPSDNVWTNIERTMDDMESRKFGGAFQQAFDDVGVRPSENVWINIELDLMRAEGGKMKRRLVFFQLLAAASIAFALGIAGIGYYIVKDQQLTGAGGQLAYQEETGSTLNNTIGATTTTAAADAPGTIPPGTRSALDAHEQGAEQGTTGIAPVFTDANAQDASHQEQAQNTSAHAASSLTLTGKAPGIATTPSDNGDGKGYVAGAAQPRKATVENAGTTATQESIVAQRAGTETQQARVQTDKQRRTRNAGTSTDGADDNHQTFAVNAGDKTSSDGRQQTLAGGTTSSGTSKASHVTQGREGIADQQQLAGTQQHAGEITSGHAEEATAGTHKKSSGSIGQDKALLRETNETAETRGATVIAAGSKQQANTPDNSAVMADATTTKPGAATPNAGKQAEYMLAYSPVPAQATPVVTSLGTRVQKPASMKVEPAATVDPLVALLARLDEQEKNAKSKDKKDKPDEEDFAPEKLWTSVGFAAGSFNTINSSVSNSSSGTSMMIPDARKDAVDQVANQQAKASGSSYSVGVSLGTRISSRWVLQGGLNYMTQASDYTASAVGRTADNESFQAQSVNSIMSADKQSSAQYAMLSNVVPTAPYNVNNSLQFVSVPVQAGYLLVNRKVGVQLNGGLSTDLFIQNTITPDGENLEKETKGNGSDSPYRTVNFSGLVGTEFTYRFSKHYRLALNPGLRYPLNSIYKSDQPVTAAPLTFDIGLRFRYIFH